MSERKITPEERALARLEIEAFLNGEEWPPDDLDHRLTRSREWQESPYCYPFEDGRPQVEAMTGLPAHIREALLNP
jgi:hypothetical protein